MNSARVVRAERWKTALVEAKGARGHRVPHPECGRPDRVDDDDDASDDRHPTFV